MSIDYATYVCDLDRYELLYSTKFSSENALWDAKDDFHEQDCLDSPSIIQGSYWAKTAFGLTNSEIYNVVRKLLSANQRALFDRFFGAVSDHCQLYSDGWFDEEMKIIDIPLNHCYETIIAAMNCDSVRRICATWEQLNLDEYLEATANSINTDNKLKSDLNFRFDSVKEYLNYIDGWGELIRFAMQSDKGLVIEVAV